MIGTEDFFHGEDEFARGYRNGSDGPPHSKLSPIKPVDLADVPVPQRQWLVQDWVPMVRVTGIYGPGGEGKTLLAQMLATAGAIGAFWLNLAVLRCNSVLAFCEDDIEEMHRRQEDINRHFGCSFADLGAMRWLPRLGDDNALMNTAGEHTPFFHQLLAAAKEHDAKLIVTDTLADVFVGNENDRGQARTFAQQALGRLARETQAAVIALAHPSRAGMSSGTGDSGSTGWEGAFRSHLYIATPTDDDGGAADMDLRVLTGRRPTRRAAMRQSRCAGETACLSPLRHRPAFSAASTAAPASGFFSNCSRA